MINANNPIYNLHSRPSCETICLTEGKSNELCTWNTKRLEKELWIQLQQPNTYIFAVNEPTLIRLTCDGNVMTEEINGVGFLNSNTCNVQTNHIILPQNHERVTNIISEFRRLHIGNMNFSIPDGTILRPTVISSTRTISSLNEGYTSGKKDVRKIDETFGYFEIVMLVLIIFLIILVIMIYSFGTWLWMGAKKRAARKRENRNGNELDEAENGNMKDDKSLFKNRD